MKNITVWSCAPIVLLLLLIMNVQATKLLAPSPSAVRLLKSNNARSSEEHPSDQSRDETSSGAQKDTRQIDIEAALEAAAGETEDDYYYNVDDDLEVDIKALTLYATAYDDHMPTEIGGVFYDEATKLWHGINEGSPGKPATIDVFQANWEPYESLYSPLGTVNVVKTGDIQEDEGYKTEGIERVPTCSGSSSLGEMGYFVASESNSDTIETSSYFSKRYGSPDLNTFVPDSLRPSRLLRVLTVDETGTNNIVQEFDLPDWLTWSGQYHWDARKCYGTRVYKGLHDLTIVHSTDEYGNKKIQLISINQIALYQDGQEPTLFDGSHIRIMVFDVETKEAEEGSGCSTSVTYSHSYRYQTSRLLFDPYQKGAKQIRGVFGLLAISPTEFLVTETEYIEGIGATQFISDIFYIKVNHSTDTVDHCESLVDCDVEVPVKHHVLRRHNPQELSNVAWGPQVENEFGEMVPTVTVIFETDDFGISMELYMLNA